MRKNQFVLLIAFVVLLVINSVSAQESLSPSPGPMVQKEQKLMVTIRLEVAGDNAIRVENQYGFALYPQTVITALSPALVLGARATIIYQDQMIPAIRAVFNSRLGLSTLLLIKPLSIDMQKTNFFSGNDFGENTFILTLQSIINIKDLTEEDARKNRLRGAVTVDDHGTLLSVVSSIEKNASGTLTPLVIPFNHVVEFVESIKRGPPIPQFKSPGDLKPEESPGTSVNLSTI